MIAIRWVNEEGYTLFIFKDNGKEYRLYREEENASLVYAYDNRTFDYGVEYQKPLDEARYLWMHLVEQKFYAIEGDPLKDISKLSNINTAHLRYNIQRICNDRLFEVYDIYTKESIKKI